MMKKLFAFVVLALFLVSIVPMVAAANNGRGTGGAQPTAVSVDAEETPEPVQVREEVKERVREEVQERKEQVNEKAKVKREEVRERKELVLQKRQVTKEKVKQLEENFKEAKRKYNEAKEKYQERRQTFLERKRQMQECEGQETEECKLARRDAHDSAKEYLLNSIERAKGHLEQLQAKIASSEGMSEE
ncbi:hypothetical protein KY325_04550, partial [Candidatus Woesearchaeota archaeon]|nr:hypothetical protein [Candidatus Woesearchaeota archaeon]